MKKNKHILLFLYMFLILSVFSLPVNAAGNLTSKQKEAINEIYQCLLSFDTEVDISEYKIPYSDEIATYLFDEALAKDDYLFNTLANISDFTNEDGFCSCYIDTINGKEYITAFEFNYKNASSTALMTQYQKLKSKVSSICDKLNLEDISNERAVLAVHDYIASHTNYDEAHAPVRTSYSAYGALIHGKAVCSGYSAACELLLDYVGIPTEIITSDAMDHAWNIVKLNKKWYHMDITWDDPYPDKENYVSYRFFLKTDKEIKKDKKAPHYSWDSPVKCTSTTYSKIPVTDNTRLYRYGKYWYYAVKNSNGTYTYKRYNFKFTSSTKLFTSSILPKKYQSRIYYASRKNQISSVNINGSVKRKIKKLSFGSKLKSMSIKNNKIYYKYKKGTKTKSGTVTLTTAMKRTK